MITIEQARKVLEVVDAGLVNGLGKPVPGQMCVEAAVCFALGEPHSDEPSCVANSVRRFKIRLNDASWSSNKARTAGMRKLAIAQLGSKDAIDEVAFAKALAKLTIQRVLPPILRKANLSKAADQCEKEGTEESARGAADYAADYAAANAARADYAADYAAASAAFAADYAAYAASAAFAADYAAFAAYAASAAFAAPSFRDEILNISANCCLDALRAVNAPGIALLDELGI